MSTIDKLGELGFDGADIHYLHQFFDLASVVVEDPRTPNLNIIHKAQRHRRVLRLERLVNAGNKKVIQQLVDYGRSGLDYELVKYVNPD